MLDDLQRAIKEVRQDSVLYGICPDRVGVMGFSAGGHLVALAGQQFDRLGADDNVRPDFIASIYPVVTFTEECAHRRSRRGIMGERSGSRPELADSLSLERHVRPDMPPVFLVNCMDDPTVHPHNAELLDSALTAVGVDHVYHKFEKGAMVLELRLRRLRLRLQHGLICFWNGSMICIKASLKDDSTLYDNKWLVDVPQVFDAAYFLGVDGRIAVSGGRSEV